LGVVRASSFTELLETLKLFCISGGLASRRLGVLTCSGADSVMLADLAAPLGVELPPLSEAQMADMREYMAGFVNLTNPLDFNTQVWGRSELEVRCFTSVMQGEQYDATALVHDYPLAERSDPAAWDGVCNSFIEAHRRVGKPAVLISNVGESLPRDARERLRASGVTPLAGLPDGMAAVRHAGWYGERRRALLEGESGA
ncbi:MAG TPA: CoA-binding protein, partial [Myxococcota bacterium]